MGQRSDLRGGFGPFLSEQDSIGGDKWWGAAPHDGPDSDFPDVRNVDAAIEFLGKSHEKPFLMVVGLWRPHTPFTAPKRFFDRFDADKIKTPPPSYQNDDLDDVPLEGRSIADIWGKRWDNSGESNPENWRRLMHGYLATTAFASWNTGRVFDALDDSEYGENTLVIFWSDNGFHMGEKDHYEKCTLWEQAALTPLAIRLPGQAQAGATSMRTVGAIDLFPTIVDYCQLESPEQTLDGRSLRPLLEEPQAEWNHPALTTYGEGFVSVRDERWRFLRYPDGTEELYDHEIDPFEFENLANEPQNRQHVLRLEKWIPETWARNLGGRRG